MKQTARNIIIAVLALLLMFSLCSCAAEEAPPPEKTPPVLAATPSPEPETPLGRWLNRADIRYNMEYEDFNDYWCLLCDEYFGEDMHKLLDAISLCKNANYDIESYNKQLQKKRIDYKRQDSKDWHFEIVSHSEEALGEQACKNFSDELQSIHDLIYGVVSKSPYWSEYDWADFAESMGCDVENVKTIIDCYSAIADACSGVQVTSAVAIELTVKFSDGSTVTDSTTLYEINGEYVSTELIDAASLLIQLIYF